MSQEKGVEIRKWEDGEMRTYVVPKKIVDFAITRCCNDGLVPKGSNGTPTEAVVHALAFDLHATFRYVTAIALQRHIPIKEKKVYDAMEACLASSDPRRPNGIPFAKSVFLHATA